MRAVDPARHDHAVPEPHRRAAETLSRTLNFAGNHPVEGVLSALALEPFVTGAQPWSCGVDLHEVGPDARLLPPGVTPAFHHDEKGLRSHLATGPGWTLLAVRLRARSAGVRVCATSEELARTVLEAATADAVDPGRATESAVAIGFWHDDPSRVGGVRSPRQVDVPGWDEIRGNYAGPAAGALDRLMEVRAEDVTGRLLLLHGRAGTGKTTAIRALARAWRDWCRVDCVLDPDALFADSAYLMSVALGDARPGDAVGWRLLVLEDCDELVRADAKRGTGQALSRLLNLTDGLLGQGLDVLVCVTTNEDITRLHPAVVRPGRCLAEIEVGPLPAQQARDWLGDARAAGSVGPEGATLAELYQLRGAIGKIGHPGAPVHIGTYL